MLQNQKAIWFTHNSLRFCGKAGSWEDNRRKTEERSGFFSNLCNRRVRYILEIKATAMSPKCLGTEQHKARHLCPDDNNNRDHSACTHTPNSTVTCRRRFGLLIANTQLHARPWVTQILHKHCSTLCAQQHRPCRAYVIQPAIQLSFST